MESSLINPSMLSMYHGLSRMPQGVPNLFQQGVPSLFRPSLPMWPHAPTHSQMQFTNSTNPYALNLQKPTDDSCGGSSASNASDTNGSGDEVIFVLHFYHQHLNDIRDITQQCYCALQHLE